MKRSDMKRIGTQRSWKAVRLYEELGTLQRVGDALGVTRERARQLMNRVRPSDRRRKPRQTP